MAERKINLDDRKYDALKRVLAAQGRDIDEEIVAQIEKLYEELVPEYERDRQFPEGSFAVYGIKDQGEVLYFISSRMMTAYRSGICYRDLDSYGQDLSLDSAVYQYFGEDGTDFIREDLFDVLVKAMANDERITAAVMFNMDSETVKVYDRDGVTVRHYTMDTFYDALESAELTPAFKETDREKVLETLLTEREYLIEPLPPKGYLEAKFIFCTAAMNVLETSLDHVDCKYTDPLSDSLCDTRHGLATLADENVMRDAVAVRPYLKEFLDQYTEQLWANGYLESYGWDRDMLAKTIVCSIENEEIQELAYAHLIQDSVEDEDNIEDCIEDSIEDAEENYEMTM